MKKFSLLLFITVCSFLSSLAVNAESNSAIADTNSQLSSEFLSDLNQIRFLFREVTVFEVKSSITVKNESINTHLLTQFALQNGYMSENQTLTNLLLPSKKEGYSLAWYVGTGYWSFDSLEKARNIFVNYYRFKYDFNQAQEDHDFSDITNTDIERGDDFVQQKKMIKLFFYKYLKYDQKDIQLVLAPISKPTCGLVYPAYLFMFPNESKIIKIELQNLDCDF